MDARELAAAFVHFVHSVPPSDAGAALSLDDRERRGLGVRHRPDDPNPWDVLPSYFDQELATLRGVAVE